MSFNQIKTQSPEISNNAFSTSFQNKVFFYFILISATILAVLKLPMALVYYEIVTIALTFAPLIVILIMAVLSFVQNRKYPEYRSIIRKFYLTFTLKFLAAILIFYFLYAPELFIAPIIAGVVFLKTVATLEGFFYFLSYFLTLVIAFSIIFVAFRAYQKSKGYYEGSIQQLTRRTLYVLFLLFFLAGVTSVAAYPEAYKPLTDTLGDTIFTLSAGNIKVFNGSDIASYKKIKSLGDFATSLSSSIAQTSQNISQSNAQYKTNLDQAKTDLQNSITQTNKDLKDKINSDVSGALSLSGGTVTGDVTIDKALTINNTTYSKSIIPQDDSSYNLGASDKTFSIIYAKEISNLNDPTSAQDASTKNYVDTQITLTNLWQRNSGNSTLSQLNANDNLNLGSGAITAGGLTLTGTLGRGTNAITGTGDLGTTTGYVGNAYITKTYLNAIAYLDGTTAGRITTTGNIVPSVNAADSLGNGDKYFANAYTNRLYLNSSAYLDGGTSGAINDTGNFNVSGNLGVGGISNPSSLFTVGGGFSSTSLVDNPSYGYGSWVTSNMGTIFGGVAYATGTPASLTQGSSTIVAGKRYKLMYNVIQSASDLFTFVVSAGGWTTTKTVSGSYVDYFTATTSAPLTFTLNDPEEAGGDGIGFVYLYQEDDNVPNFSVNYLGNVGIGTTSPTNALSFGYDTTSTAAKKIWVENAPTDLAGEGLTVSAGSAIAGTSVSNKNGGSLVLQPGVGTGNATSSIYFKTGTTLSNSVGTTLQTLSTKMIILGSGNVGIGMTTPTANFEVAQSASVVPGTVTVSGTTVTGLSTQFTNTFKVGDSITVVTTSGSESQVITAVTSNTAMTTTAFSGTAAAGTAYSVTTGGNRFVVLGNGKVGVGTITPTGLFSVSASGAKIAVDYGSYITNTSTSSTASINKYGEYISSTGTWNGTSANNFGLYVATPTGGTANYAAVFAGGNVGIGTTAPDTTLKVIGSLCVKSTDVACAGSTAGTIYATNQTVAAADYAEYFKTKNTDLKPGEVVCVDNTNDNSIKRCQNDGDNDVMGVVSTNPGIVGNNTDDVKNNPKNYTIIAMLGQIPGLVTNENGDIQIGDALTASSIPGYMRKANAGESTVGVALQNANQSKQTIQVLISRKNKSLTVDAVETQVTDRIAKLNIQDQVDNLVSQANKTLEESLNTRMATLEQEQSDLKTLIDAQMKQLQDLDLVSTKTDLNSTEIDNIKTALGIDYTQDKDGKITGVNLGATDLIKKLTAQTTETGQLIISVKEGEDPTIGTGKILKGETSLVIKNQNVKKDSNIFVTPKIKTDKVISVTEIKEDESFKVEIPDAWNDDLPFSWWIVNTNQ